MPPTKLETAVMPTTVNLKNIQIDRSDASPLKTFSNLNSTGPKDNKGPAINWECSLNQAFLGGGSYVLQVPKLFYFRGYPIHLESNVLLWARNLDHEFDEVLTDQDIKHALNNKIACSPSPEVEHLPGRTLVLSSRWDTSFFHFYNETLGKFLM